MYKLRYPPTATKVELVSTDPLCKTKYINYVLGDKIVVKEIWYRDEMDSWSSQPSIVHEGTDQTAKSFFQSIVDLYQQ